MPTFLLAVEPDSDFYVNALPLWEKHGVTLDRVQSMQEAIKKINEKPYIAIGINGDMVNFKPLLPILRDVASVPIHVVSKNFSYDDNIDAIRLGADVYSEWLEDKEQSIVRGLALFDRYIKRNGSKSTIKYHTYMNMVIYQDYRQVFICDKEVSLRKKEFDILLYLMINKGKVLSHKQIFRRVWGADFVDEPANTMWSQINNLRNSIRAVHIRR